MLDGCGIETGRRRQLEALPLRSSRSMLDGCGIETRHLPRSAARDIVVAIDARWLWDRDTRRVRPAAGSYDVAIDARWLWDRDSVVGATVCSSTRVAIDARWLWDRDLP